MHIFSFPHGSDAENIKYSYHKRGRDELYHPDKILEDYLRDEYTASNGKLFAAKAVAWKGPVLLDGGIDIKISLDEKIFADHVNITFAKGTQTAGIEVFAKTNEKLLKIGSLLPQSGATVTDTSITISLGAWCECIVIRINGCYCDVTLEGLEIKACKGIGEEPYPFCKEISFQSGCFALAGSAVCASNDDEIFAAKHLCQKLKDSFGFDPSITEAGNIIIKETGCEAEEYSIDVSAKKITVCGGSRRALLYACETLFSLCDGKNIRECKIKDEPTMESRGIHLALPSRDCLDFLKKLVKDVLVPMRYNTVFLQISAAMRYDKFPEINRAWIEACRNHADGKWPCPGHYHFVGHDILEKHEVSELCDFIRSYGLEIIPEVQCLSHSQYITCSFPDMAEKIDEDDEEIDLYTADEKIDDFYFHSLCPSHERYYEVVLGILDEVIEATKPERYVHMGHDELYDVGKCPKCRKREAADIFAEEVTALYNHLKEKGLGMMMWSDMLHEPQYKTVYAINKIPKDIIMLDFTWYFHLDEDIETALLDRGFKVIIGNLYSSHYPRYEKRSKADGIIGGEVSTWVYCSEESYAFEGKMYDLIYSANMMWHSDHRDDMRLSYNEIIKPIVWNTRKTIGDFKADGEKIKLSLDGSVDAIPVKIRDNTCHSEAIKACSANADVSIDVADFAETVCVTHATDIGAERVMWEKPTQLGEYVIEYEDGTKATEPVLYGCNIGKFDAAYAKPIASPLFRHEGYIATYMAKPECGKAYDGSDYTLYTHYISNKHKDKKINKITLHHSGKSDAAIILFDITIIK